LRANQLITGFALASNAERVTKDNFIAMHMLIRKIGVITAGL